MNVNAFFTSRHTAGFSSNPSIQNRQGAANRLPIRGRRMDRLLNILFFHRSTATKYQADNCCEEDGAEGDGEFCVVPTLELRQLIAASFDFENQSFRTIRHSFPSKLT